MFDIYSISRQNKVVIAPLLLLKAIFCFLFLFSYMYAFPEENFLLIDGKTNEIMYVTGPCINERFSPCSTFKIALSLMGFDAGILKDKKTPVWDFQKGYIDDLDSWKAPHTPQSWIQNSCVWYSQILALQLGSEKVQNYLTLLQYGNQDISGGVTKAWLSSSLQISLKEQVDFLQRMLSGRLPISSNATETTKTLLFVDNLPEGWKLFGKTGMGTIRNQKGEPIGIGWFVGWAEKDHAFFPFAYNIRGRKINPNRRIPRVKQLLEKLRPSDL